MVSFEALYQHAKGFKPKPERLLCIDPGDTTGFALFIDGQLQGCGIMYTKEDTGTKVHRLVSQARATVAVIEDYKIYPNRLKQHSLAELFTPKLIGRFEQALETAQVPIVLQMASDAKSFMTDHKLQEWGMFQTSHEKRHANDAIRHGLHYMCFGNY